MISRSLILNRILKEEECPTSSSRSANGSFVWSSMDKFEEDNLREIDDKLQQMDNEIWGKLIVMEKGRRMAKAYLRSARISIDASRTPFDGYRIGLGQFRNPQQALDLPTSSLLPNQGIELSIDESGDINITNRTGRTLQVETQGSTYTVTRKHLIFDLSHYKQKVYSNTREGVKHQKSASLIKIQMSPASNILDSSLWLCLIHLVAFEMTSYLEKNRQNIRRQSWMEPSTSSSSTSSSILTSPADSLPRWQAPRAREDNQYEECRKHTSRIQIPDEPIYTLPKTDIIIGSDHSKPQLPAATRFSQKEQDVVLRNSRGGVKKRMERDKSCGPPHRSQLSTKAKWKSSSVVDLDTLSDLRRPVYFSKPLSNRGGIGHSREQLHKSKKSS